MRMKQRYHTMNTNVKLTTEQEKQELVAVFWLWLLSPIWIPVFGMIAVMIIFTVLPMLPILIPLGLIWLATKK